MIMRIAKIVSLRISLGGTILEMMQLRKKMGKLGEMQSCSAESY